MNKQWSVLLVTVLASALLWGCGSSGGSGGSADIITMEDVEKAGITNCAQCHNTQNNNWLEGRHANIEGPNDPRPTGPHDEGSSCQPCHNLTLDAVNMPDAYGFSIRDVVSCEACHGGGSAHRGVGPIAIPSPGVDECAKCHAEKDETTGELTSLRSRSGHSPAALDVVIDYKMSGHADSPRDKSNRSGTVGCNRCHSDEGAKLYAHLNTIDDITDADGRGRGAMPLGEENISSIQCRTCHDPHNTGGNELLLDETRDGSNTVIASAQFNTCNHCHGGNNDDLIFHADHSDGDILLLDRQINDTHYDDPATSGVIEGYVIRMAEEKSCSDCHNVHSADLTIQQQWARSGHAGRILEAKEQAGANSGFAPETSEYSDAVIDAGVDSTSGDAWVHYNWDEDGRQSCQECHTAAGAANYLNDPAGYVAANNDFSHLDGWVGATGSPQNEVLTCWGCHEDAGTGELRNPGAISRPYMVGAVTVTLPDVGNSNVCINCHGARGNMEEYALAEDPATDMSGLKPGFGPGTKNVTEAHYLVAAATLYAEDTRIGYEYSDGSGLLDYTPKPYFAHDVIGLNMDSPETGSGPCAACHMGTEEGHLFEVVAKNDSGVITGLNATGCVDCHDGEHGAGLVTEDSTTAFGLQTAAAAAAFLEAEAEGYHEALEILKQALMDLGINFQSGYPYFNGASWINEGNFGAAHNYNYLHHEPGAYAHNRFYAKRLLFDSIDWVDNYALDGSITVDATSYPEAAHWFGADEGTGVATRP